MSSMMSSYLKAGLDFSEKFNRSCAGLQAAEARQALGREVLRAWCLAHEACPYLNDRDIEQLASQTQLRPRQLRDWVSNWRRRHWARPAGLQTNQNYQNRNNPKNSPKKDLDRQSNKNANNNQNNTSSADSQGNRQEEEQALLLELPVPILLPTSDWLLPPPLPEPPQLVQPEPNLPLVPVEPAGAGAELWAWDLDTPLDLPSHPL